MANVERDNMLNEEQESSQSNSSNGSSVVQPSSFQLKSSVLRQPAFGTVSFGSSSSSNNVLAGGGGGGGGFNLKPSVLRPSQLTFGSSGTPASKDDGGSEPPEVDKNGPAASGATDAKPLNPFLKTQASEEEQPQAPPQPGTVTDGADNQPATATATEDDPGSDPLAKLKSASLPKSNLFANVKSSALSETSGFVFGQNVHERVTGENLNSGGSGLPTVGFTFATSGSATNSSDSSSLGATAAAAATSVTPASKDTDSGGELNSNREAANDRDSLEEAARRYEESRGALKRKYEEVETITGEEDERNVVEVNCKLFAFAKSNWEERGHGTLRLNDKDRNESRVVFRQSGNLRVIINTKIWAGMIAQQPSPKSLRLTVIDSTGQIKVFLVMSRPELISKLHKELTRRIETAKDLAEQEAAKENTDDNKPAAMETVDLDASPKPADPTEATDGDDSSTATDEPSPKKRLSIS